MQELRYCPRCRGELEWRSIEGSGGTQPRCTGCGFVLWQNPKPCVDGLILRGEGSDAELLLGRRSEEPAKGLWDTPGGFLNVGEALEEALVRECRREIGMDVQVGRLVGAFEDEFLGQRTVGLFYRCAIVSGEPRPAPPIDEARWFRLASPPPLAFESVRRAVAALAAELSQKKGAMR